MSANVSQVLNWFSDTDVSVTAKVVLKAQGKEAFAEGKFLNAPGGDVYILCSGEKSCMWRSLKLKIKEIVHICCLLFKVIKQICEHQNIQIL